MDTSHETYAGKAERNELDLELGRILLRIRHKWLQTVQDKNVRAKEPVALEEMETVIIPADSEVVQTVSPVEDELTETIVMSPVAHRVKTTAATELLEELPETVIIMSDSMFEIPLADEIINYEAETSRQGRDGADPGQPSQSEEESLDETIMLPPKKELLKRGRNPVRK